MFSFIKRHWIAYLVGAAVAVALGFGLSYFVGVAGSTPEAQGLELSEVEQGNGAFDAGAEAGVSEVEGTR